MKRKIGRVKITLKQCILLYM